MPTPRAYPRRKVTFEDRDYAYSALLVADDDETIACFEEDTLEIEALSSTEDEVEARAPARSDWLTGAWLDRANRVVWTTAGVLAALIGLVSLV